MVSPMSAAKQFVDCIRSIAKPLVRLLVWLQRSAVDGRLRFTLQHCKLLTSSAIFKRASVRLDIADRARTSRARFLSPTSTNYVPDPSGSRNKHGAQRDSTAGSLPPLAFEVDSYEGVISCEYGTLQIFDAKINGQKMFALRPARFGDGNSRRPVHRCSVAVIFTQRITFVKTSADIVGRVSFKAGPISVGAIGHELA